jgi:hypothetical protein
VLRTTLAGFVLPIVKSPSRYVGTFARTPPAARSGFTGKGSKLTALFVVLHFNLWLALEMLDNQLWALQVE